MKNHLDYLLYVLRHKWFVFLECCRLGIPWLGITHDLSRFRPSEWIAYAASQPYNRKKQPFDLTPAFALAWNDHQHRNKHHWEYWVHFDYQDHELQLLPIPDRYRREMLADLRGASRAKGGKDPSTLNAWYLANGQKMKLHPETREWLENQLGLKSEDIS